jgi:hypothetical protein
MMIERLTIDVFIALPHAKAFFGRPAVSLQYLSMAGPFPPTMLSGKDPEPVRID